jgi:hypothetical protein
MSITAAELIPYCALNRPTDDASTGGGAISDTTAAATANKGIRPNFTQWSANAVITFQSSAAGDTGTVTINGRLSTGALGSDSVVMTGVTEKAGTTVFERILDFSISAVAVGTITVRQALAGTTRYTIPIGEDGASALFKRSASGGSIIIRYDKVFWKNTDASLTLNSAAVVLTADPDARIRIGVHTAKGDSATITNRITAPAGITFVDDNISQNIPTGLLAAGENIGVWIEENLPANDPPHRTTFTLQLSGTTV